MELINNTTKTLKDDLSVEIKQGSKLSIAAACFSIYAFQELKEQLSQIEELRFIFTSPTFVTEKAKKERREFYIPRLTRERNLYGTEFEIKLRNELTQKAIARECAEWIRQKVTFKSNVSDKSIQGQIVVDGVGYTPINNFSYTGLGACPDTRLLPKIIDGKSLTLYANIKGGTAPIPIEYFDEITNITTSKDTNIPISVKGHIYYDKVKTIATADTIEQQIGSSVKIIAPNVDKVDSSIKIHLNINLTGTLTEQIEALEFIIALVDNEAFNFGDAEFPAKFPQSELDRMEAYNFPEMLSNRKHIKEVLDSMNVKKDLKLSKCTSDDIDNLMRIVNSIGDHRIIRGEIDEKNPGQKIKIANLTVAVVYIKANGGYRIYDFFGNRFDVKWAPEGMEPVEVSQFMMMRPDDYLTLDNLDLEKVVENFKIIPPSTTHFELSNNCMLSMLNAYDKAPNPELLNAARQMNVWLGQHTDFLSSEIVTLNRLQIELRERPLEFSEKQELYTIATTAKDEFQRLGAFLLLDEQEEARKIFDTLEEDRLNLFKGFPIYKFYKYAEEKGTDGQTENANSEQG